MSEICGDELGRHRCSLTSGHEGYHACVEKGTRINWGATSPERDAHEAALQIAALRAQVEQLTRDNAALRDSVEILRQDSARVEQLIRERDEAKRCTHCKGTGLMWVVVENHGTEFEKCAEEICVQCDGKGQDR